MKNNSEESMLEEELVCDAEIHIKNTDGLHMRPAMQFVDLANQFDCDIKVSNDENTVDGKSIMQMSMLAATCGTKLKIIARGSDAKKAVEALCQLAESEEFYNPEPRKPKK